MVQTAEQFLDKMRAKTNEERAEWIYEQFSKGNWTDNLKTRVVDVLSMGVTWAPDHHSTLILTLQVVGYDQLLEPLVKSGMDINTTDKTYGSCFGWAVTRNDPPLMDRIFKLGARRNPSTPEHDPLLQAALRLHADALVALAPHYDADNNNDKFLIDVAFAAVLRLSETTDKDKKRCVEALIPLRPDIPAEEMKNLQTRPSDPYAAGIYDVLKKYHNDQLALKDAFESAKAAARSGFPVTADISSPVLVTAKASKLRL